MEKQTVSFVGIPHEFHFIFKVKRSLRENRFVDKIFFNNLCAYIGEVDYMTSEEQLKLWVEGTSVHRPGKDGGECCPDFSCCKPEFLAPAEERKLFANASSEVRLTLLIGYLGNVIDIKKVFIAGDSLNYKEKN